MRALRIIQRVDTDGTIHVERLPVRVGETVEIIVLPVENEGDGLYNLSGSGLEFWDNDVDDRAWNDAVPST